MSVVVHHNNITNFHTDGAAYVFLMAAITNQKFCYGSQAPILQRNKSQFSPENDMSAATITQAHSKGLRQQISALVENLRDFATGLFAAHGGWLAPATKESRADLTALAASAEAHSPNLSIELRYIASRG